LGAAPVLVGVVVCASTVPDESAAPPNSPAVPLSNVRRDTDCRRTVFSIVRPSQAFEFLKLTFLWNDRGCGHMSLYSLILSTSFWVSRSRVRFQYPIHQLWRKIITKRRFEIR
jgi:hypothetical protein